MPPYNLRWPRRTKRSVAVKENGGAYTTSEEVAKSEVGNKEGEAIVNEINFENLIMLCETSCFVAATNEYTNSNKLKQDATTLVQKTEVYAEEDRAKIRKWDKFPIRGEKQVACKNTTLESSSGPASLKNLFDLETEMNNQLARLNAFLKGSNSQASGTKSYSSSHLQMGLASRSASTLESIVTAGTLRKHTGIPEDHKDGDWSQLELEALWNLVRKHGSGNWNAIIGDPDLQILRGKTEKQLTEKWKMETFKMCPPVPNRSVLLPVAANTSKHHERRNEGNGFFSNMPLHIPRHGIHPFHVGVRNVGLNLGSRIMPSSSNHIFGPYHHEGSSSSSAFHSFQPLAGSHMRKANANFNTMTPPQHLAPNLYMNPNLLAPPQHLTPPQPLAGSHMRKANANFNTMTPPQHLAPNLYMNPNLLAQTPPLSLSTATRVSPLANVETDAQPQLLLLGGLVPLRNNMKLMNKNAGHDTGNTK